MSDPEFMIYRNPLSDHLRDCVHASGRMHRLRCAAEALKSFIAPRFVTTVVVMAALAAFAGVALPI